jgi:hypothetical protein
VGKRWTEEEDALVVEHYDRENLDFIRKLLPHRSNSSLCQRAMRFGLTSRTKYSHEEEFFSEPNLLNSYYAGLIAADGCIIRRKKYNSVEMKLDLESKDRYYLEKFKSSINSTGPIGDYTYICHFTGKPKEYSRFIIYTAKRIATSLEENFNITSAKTYTLNPPNLNNDLAMAYI